MLEIDVPGYRKIRLEHLVLDYNGTLACEGGLLEGVQSRLNQLAGVLQVHVVTADTFGSARFTLSEVNCRLSILPPAGQDTTKREYVEKLGPEVTACIGNGRNDALMLKVAVLGLVVIQEEGAAVETIMAADVAAPNILTALDLILQPLRLVATLRA